MIDYLNYMKRLGIRIGWSPTGADLYLDEELARVENGRWQGVFDLTLCGNEAARHKPAPDALHEAALRAGIPCDGHVWLLETA